MPNRIIKESICTSETIDQLSLEEERLFYRLMVNCDDFGILHGDPRIIKSKCFPLKESITSADVDGWLHGLVRAGLVFLYDVSGKVYLKITKWEDHQQVRAKNSKYPTPDKGNLISLDINCNQVPANVPVFENRESNNENRESKASIPQSDDCDPPAKKRKKSNVSIPEDFGISDAVRAWAAEHNYGELERHLDAFRLKCEAKGYRYANWDKAFMEAVRADWAGLRSGGKQAGNQRAKTNDDFSSRTYDSTPIEDIDWLTGT